MDRELDEAIRQILEEEITSTKVIRRHLRQVARESRIDLLARVLRSAVRPQVGQSSGVAKAAVTSSAPRARVRVLVRALESVIGSHREVVSVDVVAALRREAE